jgi:transposase
MMGQQSRTESLFYYFRLEDQIPKDHLLRVIDEQIDFSLREHVKSLYSATGRPSIDPRYCCVCCLWAIYTGSPVSDACWRR